MSLVLLSMMNNKTIVDSFKGFLVHNGILTIASGIVIGITSATFITKLVTNIVLPALYLSVFKWIKYVKPSTESYISAMFLHSNFNIIGFVQDFFTWATAMVATFIVLEFIVRRTLLKSSLDPNHQPDSSVPPHSSIGESLPNILRSTVSLHV